MAALIDAVDGLGRILESELADELEGELGILRGGAGNQAALGVVGDEIGEFRAVFADPFERGQRILLGPLGERGGDDVAADALAF